MHPADTVFFQDNFADTVANAVGQLMIQQHGNGIARQFISIDQQIGRSHESGKGIEPADIRQLYNNQRQEKGGVGYHIDRIVGAVGADSLRERYPADPLLKHNQRQR